MVISRFRRLRFIGVMIVATGISASSARADERINVLVDLSHQFSFRYSVFSGRDDYLDRSSFARTHSLASLTSKEIDLDRYDVVVLHHVDSPVDYDSAEVALLLGWVRRGGGLLMVGKGTGVAPLNRVAREFGIRFLEDRAELPYRIHDHEVNRGVVEFGVSTQSRGGRLQVDGVASVLVSDTAGSAVAVAQQVGKGRVVAVAEDHFISNPHQSTVVNQTFVRNLIRWLGYRHRSGGASVPGRLEPEKLRQVSKALSIRHSAKTAESPFVSMASREYSRVNRHLERITGIENSFEMTFLVLPCRGGGYSSGRVVGVCGYMTESAMLRTLAHELMHSFDIPNPPPEMMHPVVSWVASKVADEFAGEHAAAADRERKNWDRGFKKKDPMGTEIDVTDKDVFERRGKMFWIMGSLEGNYGFPSEGLYPFRRARDPRNFLRRYFRLKRADTSYESTPERIVELLSMAACRNLYPDFEAVGTRLGPARADLRARIDGACR